MKIALVGIAKNEDHYINEWITYHLKLGFDDVFIFQNDWRCNVSHPNVKLIDFDGQSVQMESYNYFLKTFNKKYDWAAFFDVGEFLVLKKHNSISDFISDYVDYETIAINWVFFGDNNLIFDGFNYNVLERFTKKSSKVDNHIKLICKVSEQIRFNTPHSTNKDWISPEKFLGKGPFNYNGTCEIAQLNHYFVKTIDEFKLKIDRGRADIKQFRNIEDFDYHNCNDIVDEWAINFYKK